MPDINFEINCAKVSALAGRRTSGNDGVNGLLLRAKMICQWYRAAPLQRSPCYAVRLATYTGLPGYRR